MAALGAVTIAYMQSNTIDSAGWLDFLYLNEHALLCLPRAVYVCVVFQMLSVSKEASMEEVTRSYRELVKVWHPDHNPGSKMEEAQKMFIQIQEAYETLLRAQKPDHRNK